jgi:methylglyoxal synthase
MITDEMKKLSNILEDEYRIRRMAVEFGIPVFTNLEVADAFIKALSMENGFTFNSLNEFQEGL